MFNVYITNLGKYNEGELIGKWLELPCDDIEAELESIGVSDEPDKNGRYYEEYFITGFENDYGYVVGELESLEELNELAERCESLNEWDVEKLNAYMEAISNDFGEALDNIDNVAFYPNSTLEEVAERLFDDCYAHEIPDHLRAYIDYSAFARDLRFSGFYETSGGVLEAN